MEELYREQILISTTAKMSTRKELMSISMKRTREWILSAETPSDLMIHVGETSFSLHKVPLLSKCGYIKKLISEADEAGDRLTIELFELPGGAEGFEYAAKFCYGVGFEMNTGNIGVLRCVAEFLEMTDEYAAGNLVSRTEDFITGRALQSLSGAIYTLHSCVGILDAAEKIKLVSRCIDAIAFFTCRDITLAAYEKVNGNQEVYWWAKSLSILRFDVFQRVLVAMVARGFSQLALGPVLVQFSMKFIKGLEIYAKLRKKTEPREQQEKRVILEAIVGFLPRQKDTFSVSFLSMLLKAAIYLDTTVSSRLCLEKRIALQLEDAVLGDLMIPSYSSEGCAVFDIDTVKRIISSTLEFENENHRGVSKLMEEYLAEISSDPNLSISQFISFAELISRDSTASDDGIYEAIDIYLKAHPALSDMERKKLCSVMDIQKLSLEACSRARCNKGLPLQITLQLLSSEQQHLSHRCSDYNSEQARINPCANDRSLCAKRESHEQKMELISIKTKASDTGKQSVSRIYSNITSAGTAGKAPTQKKTLISAVPIKLFPLLRADAACKPPLKGKTTLKETDAKQLKEKCPTFGSF